jgi:hypothetical protein
MGKNHLQDGVRRADRTRDPAAVCVLRGGRGGPVFPRGRR